MSETLAIITPVLGARSETFIKKHIEGLLPERTVLVTNSAHQPHGGFWDVDCPKLLINEYMERHFPRAIRFLSRATGIPFEPERRLVRSFLSRQSASIVFGEYLDRFLPWIPVVKKLGMPFFVQAHGIDVSVFLRDQRNVELVRTAYAEADGILTRAEFHRARLVEMGLPGDRIHVNPGGVDVPDRFETRTRKDSVYCFAVGRMVAKKAPILLLDAFRRARDTCPNLRLDYVGGGPLLPAALQFVQAHQLEDSVTLHGGVTPMELERIRSRADIFVQHSITDPETGDEEGLPAGIQEAMAAGLPVVSTNHAGIPEAIEHGRHGLLVEPGDTIGMADHIVGLTESADAATMMGYAGWKKARSVYTWADERSRLCRTLGLQR